MRKVSVIVPCYNAAEYLEKCVTQLIHQTIGIGDIEIILVDDASNDDGKTRELIMGYEKCFPDTIIAVFLEENMRQGGARNAGIAYAGGEYLTFCDADDWLLEEALEHAYHAAEEYDADVVAFARKDVSDRKRQIGLEKGTQNELFELGTESSRKAFLFNMQGEGYGSQNKLFRRSLILDHHIAFAEHLIMEEPSFTLPVRLYAKRYYYLDEKLYVYYLSSGSTLRSKGWESRKWDNLQVWIALIEELRNRNLLQIYVQELEYLFFVMGYGWTISMMFQRGCILTKEEWRSFVDIVRQIVPSVRENQYVNGEKHPFNQAWNDLLLAILDMDFSDENAETANTAVTESVRAFSSCPAFL